MQKPAILLIHRSGQDVSVDDLRDDADVLSLTPEQGALENVNLNQFQIVLVDRSLEKLQLIPFLELSQARGEYQSTPFICFYGELQSSIHTSWFQEGHSSKNFDRILELYSSWLKGNEGVQESLKLGPIEISLSLPEMKITDFDYNETVHLTPREYKILLELLQTPGRPVTRDRLMEVAWPAASDVKPRTIDVHIASLRKKLGPFKSYIRSIQSTGYIISMTFQ